MPRDKECRGTPACLPKALAKALININYCNLDFILNAYSLRSLGRHKTCPYIYFDEINSDLLRIFHIVVGVSAGNHLVVQIANHFQMRLQRRQSFCRKGFDFGVRAAHRLRLK